MSGNISVPWYIIYENGSVGRKPGSGRPKKRTPEVIEEARQAMEEAPGTSIEHLSQQLGVSVGTCHSIVKKDLHLNINAARYRNEILTPFLNQLHDDELVYGYFQQDGATAHTTTQGLQ
jgi:hypothetical protein